MTVITCVHLFQYLPKINELTPKLTADYEPHGTVLDVLRGLLDPRPKKRLTAREATQKIIQRSESNLDAIAIRPGSLTSPASNSFFVSPVTMRGFAQYFDTTASQPVAPSRYRNDFEEVEWLVSSISRLSPAGLTPDILESTPTGRRRLRSGRESPSSN